MRKETIDRAFGLLRKVLKKPEEAGAPVLPEDLEATEFRDLQAEIGAVLEETPESDLRDATIAELRDNLERLKPLGVLLAEAERRRLATEEQLARLMLAHEALQREHDEEREAGPPDARLARELERQSAARQRAEERLDETRAKLDEKRLVASERWKEIRALRARAKEAERELAAERKRLKCARAEVKKLLRSGKVPTAAARAKLAELMQIEASTAEAPPRAARPRKRSTAPAKPRRAKATAASSKAATTRKSSASGKKKAGKSSRTAPPKKA